jgi:hypothetical protein
MNRRTLIKGTIATAAVMALPTQATLAQAEDYKPARLANREFESDTFGLVATILRYNSDEEAEDFCDWFGSGGMGDIADSMLIETGYEVRYTDNEPVAPDKTDQSIAYAGGIAFYQIAYAAARINNIVFFWTTLGEDAHEYLAESLARSIGRIDTQDTKTDEGLLALLPLPSSMQIEGFTMTDEYVGVVPADATLFN